MSNLLQLSYWEMFLAVLAQQLGLPIPSVVFLMAAGALAAQGKMHSGVIVVLGVVGCLAGDGVWYWIGRKWGPKAMRLLCRFSADPRTEKAFHDGIVQSTLAQPLSYPGPGG